jgi:hypothetical protein
MNEITDKERVDFLESLMLRYFKINDRVAFDLPSELIIRGHHAMLRLNGESSSIFECTSERSVRDAIDAMIRKQINATTITAV